MSATRATPAFEKDLRITTLLIPAKHTDRARKLGFTLDPEASVWNKPMPHDQDTRRFVVSLVEEFLDV